MNVLDITNVMTRKGSIHNIMMGNHFIYAANRRIVVTCAQVRRNVKGFWESDGFAYLPKLARL